MSDINFPNNPVDGQFYVDDNQVGWEYQVDQWVSSKSGRTLTIAQMSDVDITNPQDGQVLKYDGSVFKNVDLPATSLPAMQKNYPTNKYPWRATNSYTSFGSGSWRVINFNIIVFDPYSVFNTTTTSFVAPVAGTWQFILKVRTVSSDDEWTFALWVNSVYRSGMTHGSNDTGDTQLASATRSLKLNANDSVAVRCYANFDLGGNGILANTQTEFSGYLKRSA